MRQVDGGVFLNEPNIWLIAETMRKLLNESIAKECGVELTKVTVMRKDTGEIVPPGRVERRECGITTHAALKAQKGNFPCENRP